MGACASWGALVSFTARISGSTVTQVDRPASPDAVVTEEDVKDPSKLARLVMSIAKDVAQLRRRFAPRRIDFEDVEVDNTGTTLYRFEHGFGGRVRWWPVDFEGAGATSAALARHSSSDNDTLVLYSLEAGTATIRVEEAG